jgi:hypothetical protein
MRRKRRDDHYDARITRNAIDLYKLGKSMLAEGISDTSTEFYEVENGLHRELRLRPWQISPFDFELFVMKPPSPPVADWRLVHELHRRLVAASA